WCMSCLRSSFKAPYPTAAVFMVGCQLTIADSVLCGRCNGKKSMCVEPKAAMTGDARNLSALIRWVETFWAAWPINPAGFSYPVWDLAYLLALNNALKNCAKAFNHTHVKYVGAFKIGNSGNKYFDEPSY
ncbi:unnamed protein product, partial [Penicillium olsonii]